MAHNESGLMSLDTRTYGLGGYIFGLSAQVGDSSTTCIVTCTHEGQAAMRRQTINGKAEGWYVEADETEATVYAKIRIEAQEADTGGIVKPVPKASTVHLARGPITAGNYADEIWLTADAVTAQRYDNNKRHWAVMASSNPNSTYHYLEKRNGNVTTDQDYPLNSSYTLNGLTVYYSVDTFGWAREIIVCEPVEAQGNNPKYGGIAWEMIYGRSEAEDGDKLVARFAIELAEADGGPEGGWIGPGGGWIEPSGVWDEPGDVDYDWEPGDPTHTLRLNVTGALSGRHNDPVEDPSYSYTPYDQDSVPGYGCGGDGGHGGGGGAGASTVIVRQFATGKAKSKEITALARRHGYGSGGGKGGKGGDGIILIYY